ncbi:MAG TPA: NADH-quinone oxidoreductase subunit C [Pyrinomonadaceae bacterium]|jgi:NADH-quinone oxidoreductase subunit C|nr:NADH-quinone oxidoreductase subunit C [Pyrinomonadaceae bacterium]
MIDETDNPKSDDSAERATDEAPAPSRSDDKSPSPDREIARAGNLPAPPHADAPPSPESQAAPQAKAPSGQSRDTVMGASSGDESTDVTDAPPADETPEQKRARMMAEVKAKAAARMAAKGTTPPAKPETPAAAPASLATPPPAATPPAPPAAAASGDAPEGETLEEKRARIIAEAKAKAAAKMAAAQTGDETPDAAKPPVAATPSSATSDEEKAARIAEARAKAAALKPSAGATPASGAAGAPKAPVKKKEEGAKPADASAHPLVKRLKENLDGAVIEATEFLGQLSVRVEPARIVAVCEFLKRDAVSPFDYLSDLTCVHFPENADAPFEVVYNLYSISGNVRVRLKAQTTEAAGVESVTGVWPAANWMEREVYDLFGVRFRNHPDLRRILLPPDWEGHPLRKDYPLEPVENNWTAKHLPEFSDVQREQLEQRRAYGLEALSTPDERRIREIFIAGKEVMPLDRK